MEDDEGLDSAFYEAQEIRDRAIRRVANARHRLETATAKECEKALTSWRIACGNLKAVIEAIESPWEFRPDELRGLGFRWYVRYGEELVKSQFRIGNKGKMSTYDEEVRGGKADVAAMEKSQWSLGDRAMRIETVYKGATLSQYADDIGAEFETLAKYRYVSEAYENRKRFRNVSWGVHMVFAAQEDRLDLLRDGNPDTDPPGGAWTARTARALVKARNDATKAESAPSGEEDSDEPEEREREETDPDFQPAILDKITQGGVKLYEVILNMNRFGYPYDIDDAEGIAMREEFIEAHLVSVEETIAEIRDRISKHHDQGE